MGTNFFWIVEHQESKEMTLPTGATVYRGSGIDHCDPNYHLGKRSAAGLYCWDCKLTLCRKGEAKIHFTEPGERDTWWSKTCLKCGKGEIDRYPDRFQKVTGEEPAAPANAGMVELGFDKPNVEPPKGVASCCSFSWAQDPEKAIAVCRARPDDPLIEDEYGRVMTGIEFMQMLEGMCPVHFTHSIGQQFS